ncbi:MAG TPA: hypothetical protein VFT22_23485, partial [Kofleriaceae bacterium]|nr:hypothetical protein [Kofleriaceae bacterium]
MGRPGYLATIARRAQAMPGATGAASARRASGAGGAAAALVPPSIPMRGWEGAWPSELPPAEVIRPASGEARPVPPEGGGTGLVGAAEPAMAPPLLPGAASAAPVEPGLPAPVHARIRSASEGASGSPAMLAPATAHGT